jgi:hypothetical protein
MLPRPSTPLLAGLAVGAALLAQMNRPAGVFTAVQGPDGSCRPGFGMVDS